MALLLLRLSGARDRVCVLVRHCVARDPPLTSDEGWMVSICSMSLHVSALLLDCGDLIVRQLRGSDSRVSSSTKQKTTEVRC